MGIGVVGQVVTGASRIDCGVKTSMWDEQMAGSESRLWGVAIKIGCGEKVTEANTPYGKQPTVGEGPL